MQDFPVHRAGGGFGLGWFAAMLALATIADASIAGGYSTRERVVAISVATLVALLSYVFGIRPCVAEEPSQLLVRNPIYDVAIPWGAVIDVRMADVLVIEAGKDVRCYAVPRRRARVRLSNLVSPEPPAPDLLERLRTRAASLGARTDGQSVIKSVARPVVLAGALGLVAAVVLAVAA